MVFKTRIMMLVSLCTCLLRNIRPGRSVNEWQRNRNNVYMALVSLVQHCQILSSFSSWLTPCKLRLSLYMRRIQVSCPEFTGTNRLFFWFAWDRKVLMNNVHWQQLTYRIHNKHWTFEKENNLWSTWTTVKQSPSTFCSMVAFPYTLLKSVIVQFPE